MVHPIRWPGSWHRKAAPTLCTLKTANPDAEIDLDAALAALRTAAPDMAASSKAATPPAEWRRLAQGVAHGERNCTAARLAGYLLRRRVDPVVALEMLQRWNAARCPPPLPDSDSRAEIVDSIAAPRAEPPRRAMTDNIIKLARAAGKRRASAGGRKLDRARFRRTARPRIALCRRTGRAG